MNDTSKRIYDKIRQEWVAATPEEIVRQKLINVMTHELGYPESLLCVEKSLHEMPHLASISSSLPYRRTDIICFARDLHPDFSLYPLLTIECKAVPITQAVVSQVEGYNHYLKSYYICVVNDTEIKTGWFDSTQNKYLFVDTLPSYAELLRAIK
jgi:hypothetical protein